MASVITPNRFGKSGYVDGRVDNNNYTTAFAKHLTNHFRCEHWPDVFIMLDNKLSSDVCYFH